MYTSFASVRACVHSKEGKYAGSACVIEHKKTGTYGLSSPVTTVSNGDNGHSQEKVSQTNVCVFVFAEKKHKRRFSLLC